MKRPAQKVTYLALLFILLFLIKFNVVNSQSYLIGPTSPAIGTSANYTAHNHFNLFNVLNPDGVFIDSITIYPATASAAYTIIVQNSSQTVIASSSGVTTIGANQAERVKVNIFVPLGTGYRLGLTTSSVGMLRNSTGAVHPYTVPGIMTITGNTFDAVYWYFFYNIRIKLPSIITDAGLTSMIFPTDTICNGSQNVNVRLRNFGPVALNSAKIDWRVNNVAQTQFNWSGSLGVNDSTVVNIGTFNFLTGTTYNVVAFSSLPNNIADTMNLNDTIKRQNIFVKQRPSATPTSTALSMCVGDSVLISGTLSGTPPWNMIVSDGTTSYPFNNITSPLFGIYVSPTTSRTYTVTSLTDLTGCSATGIPPIVVTVNPLPAASTGGPKSICIGSSTIIGSIAIPGNTYLWTPATGLNSATISNPTANPTVTTTYTLLETRTVTGCKKQNTMVLTVNPIPIVNAGSNQTIPSGTSTILSGSATGSPGPFLYSWKPTNLLVNSNIANPTTLVLNFTTVFTLIVTDSVTGCKDSSTMTVIISGGPLFSLLSATPSAICHGSSSQINALVSGGGGTYTYSWTSQPSGFSSTLANPIVSPTITTKYFVLISDGTLTKTDSVNVPVNENPLALITAGGSTTLCQGGFVMLNANTGTNLTYQWFKDAILITGATGANFTVTTAGIYTCVVKNQFNCPTTSNALVVVVNSNPTSTITLGGPTSICQGDSVLLTANSGAGLTYQWKLSGIDIIGATQQTFYAKQSGGYTVVVTNSFLCSTTSSSQNITVNSLPTSVITPTGPTTFCGSSSVVLNANTGTGFSYKWYRDNVLISGATAASYTANLAGSYTVLVTNVVNCTKLSAPVVITLLPTPTSTISASGPTTFCVGDSVALTANAGSGLTYQWKNYGNDISGAVSINYTAKFTGNYTVVVSNGTCSTTSAVTNVVSTNYPSAVITAGGGTTFCTGDSLTLYASTGSGFTHKWYKDNILIPGATQSYLVVKNAGSYHVVITANLVCSSVSSPIVITVNPAPIATITPAGQINLCQNDSIVLMAATGTGYTYQWKKDGFNLSGAISSTLIVKTAGTYMVVTSFASCSSNSNSVVVNSIPAPVANITYTGSSTFCHGDSLLLKAQKGTGYLYQWNKNGIAISGATDTIYAAKTLGTYTLVTTLGSCTKTSLPVSVITKPLHNFNLGKDTSICNYKSIVLNAGVGASSYLWSTGVGTSTITVDSAGIGNGTKTIWVAADLNGCKSYDTIKVTFVSCTGINDLNVARTIKVYPNPSGGIFTIEFQGQKSDYEITIFDLTGKKFYSDSFKTNEGKSSRMVDISIKPKGLYFLKISNEKFIRTEKLLIQ